MTIREHQMRLPQVLKGDVSLQERKQAESNGTNGELRSHETQWFDGLMKGLGNQGEELTVYLELLEITIKSEVWSRHDKE